MSTLQIHNQQGQVVGEQEIAQDLAGESVHTASMHQAVVAQLANRRRGTACTKTRAEVRGSGRKLYRQKGTGRARVGTNRSPIRVGGGAAFGPKPRSYRQATPKKVKRLAFRAAIADKLQSEKIVLVQTLQFDRPRTKDMAALLKELDLLGKKVLVVLEQNDENIYRSARNIPNVNVTTANLANTYQLVWHDTLVVTQDAMAGIEQRCFGLAAESAEADVEEAEAV